MKKTKLFKVLSSFSSVEMNRLKKFAHSPYFNKNKAIQLIIKYLDDVLREDLYKDNELSKQLVWSHIKNNQNFDDRQFRKICSDSLKLVEKWLIQEEFEDDPFYQANFLLDSIYEKNLLNLKKGAIRSVDVLFNRRIMRNGEYFFQKYRQERSYYNLFDYEKNRYADSNLDQIDLNLDVFYFSEKMRNACTSLSRQDFTDQKSNLILIDDLCDKVEELEYLKYPPIKAYFSIYKMNREFEDEKHFFNLKKWLDSNIQFFPQFEAYEIYQAAATYCINKTNLGNFNFFELSLDLYKRGLEHDIFLINNKILSWDFKNIAFTAIRLKEFKWTTNFINFYSNYLEDEEKDNIITYLRALIAFYQNKFDEVVYLLQNVEYSDLTYSMNSKAMLVGAYYELDEVEVLSSFISSFRTFLNRKKIISKTRKLLYINFLNFTRKLMSSRVAEKSKILKLQLQIQNEKNVASKQWLLDKVEEMI